MIADVGVVFAAEFARRVRSRGFLIGTIIGILAMFAIAAFPSISACPPGASSVEGSGDIRHGVASALVMILYIVVLVNSQMLTSSVAEEKTSRIAELLVAAVSPASLLAGKVLATGATGCIQLVLWCAAGFTVVIGALGSAHQAPVQMMVTVGHAISPWIAAAFLTFFVIGFLEYALLFAAVASLITRTEELGSVTIPLALPVVAALLIAQYATDSPNVPVAVATSFVPLLSPFVMFTRMLVSDVPAWQVVISLALNVAALAVIVPFAGKLYRIGLLLYGRAPKLTQIWTVLKS